MQRIPYFLVVPLFWVLSIYLLTLIYQDLQLGGNPWKQGDWLINNEHDTVRRGAIGSAILALSRSLALNPVSVVISIQAGLVISTVGLIALSLRKHAAPYTLWLLVIVPGFFLHFWSLDDQGGLRKELIIYSAFAVLLCAATHPRAKDLLLVCSAAIFCLGVFAHEGNVFFAPFFAFCYSQFYRNSGISKAFLTALLMVLGLSSLGAIGVALIYRNIDGYMDVCAPLLREGVGASLCEGAIKALEIPLANYMEITFWILFSTRSLSFALLYILASIPVVVIGAHFFDRRTFIRHYLISALFFLPLYVIAVDWGRWVSWHITAVVFTMLIVLSVTSANNAKRAELSPPVFLGLLVFSLCLGFSHFVNVLWGGIFLKTVYGVMGWPVA